MVLKSYKIPHKVSLYISVINGSPLAKGFERFDTSRPNMRKQVRSQNQVSGAKSEEVIVIYRVAQICLEFV